MLMARMFTWVDGEGNHLSARLERKVRALDFAKNTFRFLCNHINPPLPLHAVPKTKLTMACSFLKQPDTASRILKRLSCTRVFR